MTDKDGSPEIFIDALDVLAEDYGLQNIVRLVRNLLTQVRSAKGKPPSPPRLKLLIILTSSSKSTDPTSAAHIRPPVPPHTQHIQPHSDPPTPIQPGPTRTSLCTVLDARQRRAEILADPPESTRPPITRLPGICRRCRVGSDWLAVRICQSSGCTDIGAEGGWRG